MKEFEGLTRQKATSNVSSSMEGVPATLDAADDNGIFWRSWSLSTWRRLEKKVQMRRSVEVKDTDDLQLVLLY